MNAKLRICLSIIWTSLLFALYQSIHDMFLEPLWKPFLIFMVLLSLLTAAIYLVSRINFPPYISTSFRRVISLHQRSEKVLYSFSTDMTFFLHLWFLLTICYAPAYLALFPGTFGYDAPMQVAQYFRNIALTSHHPLAHTYLLGFFFSLGTKLFHSYSVGFALYTAFQGIVVTGSIAYCLTICKKRQVPFFFILLSAIWFVINPYLQILSFNSTKDILFGAFLLGFGAACWDFLESTNPRKIQYITLIVFGILMCLFRNQGIYILVAMLLLCLILRTGKKGFYPGLISILLFSLGFFTLCSTCFHIPKGELNEMLCVPMQQLARVGYYKDETAYITREQLAILNEIIPEEGIQSYQETTADPVKSLFQTQAFEKDFIKHIKNYIAIGLQNPRAYLDAWLYLIHSYWKPYDNDYKGLTYAYTFSEMNQWEIQRSSKIGRYYNYLLDKLYTTKDKLHNRPDLCLWLLAGISGYAIAKGRKKLFISILPFAFYLGTAILGPVALLRYLYPLTLATPILFCMFFAPIQHASTKK